MMAWSPDSDTAKGGLRDDGPAPASRAAVNLIRELIIGR